MTAETITAAPTAAHIRHCGCGAHVEYQRDGEEAERAFALAHYACEATAILDDGHHRDLVAMRGIRTVAHAADWGGWSTGWAVYMGDRSGEVVQAEVTDRATAEAVLKLILTAYDKAASR